MKVPAPAKRGRNKKLPTAVAVGSFSFKEGIPKDELRAVLEFYLGSLGVPEAGLSLLVCGDSESCELNRDFRRQDKPTDILSFPTTGEGKTVREGFSGHLGDLALNLPYAWRNRGRFSDSFGSELAFLLLHGLLHLMGYHHDTLRQERIMQALARRHFPPPKALLETLSRGIKIKRSWSL
jgi:probable rRNA maturation factor